MSPGAITLDAEPLTPIRAGQGAWGVCWLMFVSTVLCYMDRQTIALVKPAIVSEFAIPNDETYGWLMAAFLLPYALFQVPSGFLADAGDVRRLYAMAVGGWSLAGIAAAFSPTLGALMACRVMLGVGESFNWPCGLRVTSRILPPADRGLGNGIFNSGAAVGAVLAPLTIPVLAERYGWRVAFAAIGALGFAWVALWMRFQPAPDAEKTTEARVTRAGQLTGRARGAFLLLVAAALATTASAYWYGRAAIWWGIAVLMIGALIAARILPVAYLAGRGWSEGLGAIVRRRRFWVMVVVSVSVNVSWHYLVSWLGDFFQTGRKLGMVRGALVSAVPFLAADAGNLLGGAFSRGLSRRGMSLIGARRTVMALGAALVASGSTIGRVGDTRVAVLILSVMAAGAAMIMANYFALCQDVLPRHTGLVVGILGGLGNLFAGGFLPVAGRLQDVTHGYGASFLIVSLLPILGLVALTIGWGRDPDPDGSP